MKYFRYTIITVIFLLIFGGYFGYLTFSGQIDANPVSNALIAVARPYPALINPKTITLNCDYHGKKLSISETLYGSLNDYYKNDPAKRNAYLDNDEEKFVFSYAKDSTITDLAAKILAVGAENGLNRDQALDLGACMMQNIPYDSAKAQKILGPDFAKMPVSQVIPRYPYETLYDYTGICTDKTFLGAAVFREMGYETAILTFDTQKHMSLGIGVPSGYGSFNTDYGIMELTGSGFLVGDVPELSANVGLAINNFQTIPQGENGTPDAEQLKLSSPSGIFPVSKGTLYDRISARTAIRRKMEALKPQLDAERAAYLDAQELLKTAESQVKVAENAYTAQPTTANYNAYLKVYNSYQAAYNAAQSKIDTYNKTVNIYNKLVEQYREF